jgi:hypothetical protein
VHGRSRTHTKIGAQGSCPVDVAATGDDRDQAGPILPETQRGEHEPAVEGRQREVDEHRVEELAIDEGKGFGSIVCDGPLDVVDIGAVSEHQHARHHRAPPP